ncbi:MAG: universal stress protein [Salinirussus sp.]
MTDRPVREDLFENVLVPIASIEDAEATCDALQPHLQRAGGSATVLHVLEKTEGGIDQVPLEARREDAERMFETLREEYGDRIAEMEMVPGSDVPETIFERAREMDATGIVFMPREANRFVRWLTGDVALALITESPVPVLTLPHE